MRSITSIITVLFITIAITSNVFAGAWTQKKGNHYLRLYANYFTSNKRFNFKGEEVGILSEQFAYQGGSFRDVNLTIYYEYGLFDRLTVIGNLPYKSYTSTSTVSTSYTSGDVEATTSGFADLKLSARVGIIENPVVFSLQGGVKIPLGYEQNPQDGGPRLGTGYIDYEGQLLLGASLYPIPSYITGGFGYRRRGGNLHDEWLFNIEMGYTFGKFLFKTYFEMIRNTIDPPDVYGQPIVTPLPGGGGVLPDVFLYGVQDEDVTKILPSIIYTVTEGIAIQAEINHILSGKNTLSGTTYSFGLIFSR
jgi:hypothetical protein